MTLYAALHLRRFIGCVSLSVKRAAKTIVDMLELFVCVSSLRNARNKWIFMMAAVRAGQAIGTVGLTAGDGRPSIHFETRQMRGDDPVAVDPISVLPR